MAYIICEPCVGTKDPACVDVCPTGALFDVDRDARSLGEAGPTVRSVCGYCGVGCNVEVTTSGRLS